jgi:hypothetical protein
MERRQIWRKRAFFDEKWALVPTQVMALTDFFDEISGFSASFAVVTLAPNVSA